MNDRHDVRAHGVPPLTGNRARWMDELLGDPDEAARLLDTYGSPVNVFDFDAVPGHAAELVDAAAALGVDARVFVARKANKALGLVDTVRESGLGMDVASLGELEQCLDAGLPGERIVVSAAVKSRTLLQAAVGAGAAISLDNADELAELLRVATPAAGRRPRTALRLAVSDLAVPSTRFGLTADAWLRLLDADPVVADRIGVEGIHFHLNGYSASERSRALAEACAFADRLRDRGHEIGWIDMGGGVPMSYLSSAEQWRTFWQAVAAQTGDEVTWRGDRLAMTDPDLPRPSPQVYPYYQAPVRGEWLSEVLGQQAPEGPEGTVADLIRERGLQLRLEPGRAMLDGCGVTLARVAFRKVDRDGTPLVGLHMNRTQVRSTSLDFLVDPVLLRPSTAEDVRSVGAGFLVGAYCIEEELLLRRRMAFPDGVARGDVVAFINTAGYLTHIVESASHQIPLAANLLWSDGSVRRDPIDTIRG